jgi:hypothetical protein
MIRREIGATGHREVNASVYWRPGEQAQPDRPAVAGLTEAC